MPNEHDVHIARDSIEQAWEATGEDFWIRLITEQVDGLDTVKAALVAADGAEPNEEIDFGSMELVPAPNGYAVMVGPALWDETVYPWIHRFAVALQERGISGRLEGITPEWRSPILDPVKDPALTLFTRFALPSPAAATEPVGWEIPPRQTRDVIAAVLEWATPTTGAIFTEQGSLRVKVGDDLDLQAHLERVLHTAWAAGVDVIDPGGKTARHAVLVVRANGIFQVVGRRWEDTIEELAGLARTLPPRLDLAFVRIAQRGIGGLHGLDSVQPLDRVRESAVRSNEHLLDRYIPDAHGVQIVNDTHLAAATDLSRWEITDLGQGRHLVVAPDLEAWYAHGLPDPDVLARARADWAGAILTEEIVATDWRSRQTAT